MVDRPTKRKAVYILFNKPHGVLSQFTDPSGRKTLSQYGPFPTGIYPVGRLDADSEGLLLLTNDRNAKTVLLEPRYAHTRTYLVLVERVPDETALLNLRMGVRIEGRLTRKAEVKRLDAEPALPPREVPIRFRKNVPTAWLEITLTEGRNRQIRKMTAAVGNPTLRLVRIRIASLSLGDLKPGEYRQLTSGEVRALLGTIGIARIAK